MNESAKMAVFLSYASQDTEAARSICDALRSVGVEVWFDAEGGLEHGDEWDAKIRRQIKECALFIPVISKATQARHEGYFRIEWDLADERAHGIAAGVPFILPVIVDETREADALVPDRFRKVQWTRLPRGVASPEVKARFLKLWSHRTGAASLETARANESLAGTNGPPHIPSAKRYFVIAGAAVAVALGATWWLAHPRKSTEVRSAAEDESVMPASESERLVAKIWELLNKPELASAQLNAADDLCKHAVEIDPNNADVCAACSQVNTWYVYHRLEDTPARREAARDFATKAMQLAPTSYESRLAEACYIVRCTPRDSFGKPLQATEAEATLRQLLGERPDEPRALFALAILERNLRRLDEAVASFDRLAKNPAFAATAYCEKGWVLREMNRFSEAGASADRSIAIKPFFGNLSLKIHISLIWDGDIKAAQAAVALMPAETLAEDFGNYNAYWVYEWSREPDEMLRVLDAVPHEWLASNMYTGPKKLLIGNAYDLAGRKEAAKLEWLGALQLVEQKLTEHPDDAQLYRLKYDILFSLHDRDGAAKAHHLYYELIGQKGDDPPDPWLADDRDGEIRFIADRIVNKKDMWFTAATMRLSPDYDDIRQDPRFQDLLARCEADPLRSPKAKTAEEAKIQK
jgi:tetratricopeptide (TPR) repeat protein